MFYYGYLGVGPWAAVRFLKGELMGFYQLGRVFFFQEQEPRYEQNVDSCIATTIHMTLTLLPLTLVFASTASRQASTVAPWSMLYPPKSYH